VLPVTVWRKKIGTGAKIFLKNILFLFFDIPCNVTQQLIAETDVDGHVTLDWSFSRQVVQHLNSARAIEFCRNDPGQHYQKAQILFIEYWPKNHKDVLSTKMQKNS